MTIYFYLLIVVAALCGLGISWYIDLHKRYEKKLICPLNSDCEKVVHSEYNNWLGVSLERWGVAYYGLMALVFLVLLGAHRMSHRPALVFAGLIGTFAFIFSLHLTNIQLSRIKEWCAICIASTLCATIIFLALIGNWLAV